MASDSKKTVLLLKSLGKDGRDNYVEALEAVGFEAHCVPVLSFQFTNIDQLSTSLRDHDEYFGLILTSPRAVESVQMASDSISGWKNYLCEKWKIKPVFVVGEATGREVSKLGLIPVGADSGNADALAGVILDTDGVKTTRKPLLFPVSAMGRDVLPSRLAQERVALDKIITYETVPDPDMTTNLSHAISTKFPDYIVFFSPSGVSFTWNLWPKLGAELEKVKCVAIGPTTQNALEDKGIRPLVASKPSPESLIAAIRSDI